MKRRSTLSLIVSFAVVATGSLSVYAQSQRYPTNVEIQQIIREFQQRASSPAYSRECCGGTEADTRTAAQRQPLESFVKVWSRVDPTVSPFLGWWTNNDGDIGVYPSNVRGRVCVIRASLGSSYKFSVGSISSGKISLSGDLAGRVLLNQRTPIGNTFLLVAYVGSDNTARAAPGSDIYTYPQLPQAPTKLPLSKTNPQENSRMIREFNVAGCTVSLPKQ